MYPFKKTWLFISSKLSFFHVMMLFAKDGGGGRGGGGVKGSRRLPKLASCDLHDKIRNYEI